MALVLENSLELNLEYDEEDDVLYAWVGEKPTAAITYETDEGHLVRLDPESKEFVGVTIYDYRAKWDDLPISIAWEVDVEEAVPWISKIARKRKSRVSEHRVLRPRVTV